MTESDGGAFLIGGFGARVLDVHTAGVVTEDEQAATDGVFDREAQHRAADEQEKGCDEGDAERGHHPAFERADGVVLAAVEPDHEGGEDQGDEDQDGEGNSHRAGRARDG